MDTPLTGLTCLTGLAVLEIFLPLRDDTNHDILVTAPSTSTAVSPTESSSMEGRPAKGTPMIAESSAPVSQAETEAEEFLNSMAEVLEPSKGGGVKESPVRPRVRLPPVSGSTGSSFASAGSSFGGTGARDFSSFASSVSSGSSVGGLRTQPVSSRFLGSKASPAGMSSAESSRVAATLPQTFESQLVLDGEPSKSASVHHGIGLGVSVPTSASVTGLSSCGNTTPAPLREPLGPPTQSQGRGLLENVLSVPPHGTQLIDGQVRFAEILLEGQSLTMSSEDDSRLAGLGDPFPIGCPVLLRSALHHGTFVSTICFQIRRNERTTDWRTAYHVWAHCFGRGDLGLGLHGSGGGL
jgi:hypothetical protein